MKQGNRLLYVGGVALLVALTLWGLLTRGTGESEESPLPGDGGPQAGEAAPGPVGADAAAEAAAASGQVPFDGGDCEAYCRQLAQDNGLAPGVTTADCIDRLCGEAADRSGPLEVGAAPSVVSLPEAEPPDDCRQQCQLLQQRGELREGTTLEQCYAALCAP